jgi:hypothetical protein
VVTEVSLDRVTNLFLGTKMSGFDLGLNLKIGLDSYTEANQVYGTDTVDNKESARYIALAGGISNEKMDLGLLVELPAVSSEPGTGSIYSDSKSTFDGFGLGFNGRFWLEKKDKFQLLPVVVAYYGSASRDIKTGGPLDTTMTTDYGRLNLAGGLGINYQLNEDNLLVIGLEAVGYAKESEEAKNDYKSSITTMTLPGIYFGLESKISKWLVGRLGAAQVFQSFTDTYEPQGGTKTESTTYSTQFKMTFGLGITFGNFLLDAAFNEGLLFDGPYFISGTAEPIANRLSITYNF